MKLWSALLLSLSLGLAVSALPVVAGANSAQAHDAIELPMKKMRSALRDALSSSDLASFSQHFARFKQAALQAGQQQYHGNASEQQTYQEGMKALQEGLAKVEALIAAKQLEQAKAALDELNQIKKQYHKKLDV